MRKKKVTAFVLRMRELSARLKPVLFWDSSQHGTYRRSFHKDKKK